MATAFSLTLGYMADRLCHLIVASAFAAYITGNVASNFFGRMISVAVYDHSGLSSAFYALAILNLSGGLLALRLFAKEEPKTRIERSAAGWRNHLYDPALRAAFLVGYLVLFAFLGVFTYVNFHLVRHGFGLTMAEIGLIHVVFVPSILRRLYRHGSPRSYPTAQRSTSTSPSRSVDYRCCFPAELASWPQVLAWSRLERLPPRRQRPVSSALRPEEVGQRRVDCILHLLYRWAFGHGNHRRDL